jgi:hypothetical protein
MLSIKSHFPVFLCLISLSLNAHPKNLQDEDYIQWDNKTIANKEDLLLDPLLALRHSKRFEKELSIENFKRTANPSISLENVFPPLMPISETLLNDSKPKIMNKCNDFNKTRPYFQLSNHDGQDVWWQISTSSDFSTIHSSFEKIIPETQIVSLSNLEETFLNHETVYFFRARTGSQNHWSSWSDPFAFTVVKPNPVTNLHIETDDQTSILCWNSDDERNTFYVFGSNSMDFIPNIYASEEPEAMDDTTILASSPTHNFLGETQATQFPIDQRYAYYRVIAKNKDHFSVPSKLLPMSDAKLTPEGRKLQYQADGAIKYVREPLPESYSWTQKRVHTPNGTTTTKYVQNPYVTEEMWNTLSPYFLPEHFPEKAILDEIFSQRRVLGSHKMMQKSGFIILSAENDKIVVAKHVSLKGYIIKAYTDEMPYADWYWWKKRIDGMRVIQAKINELGYQGIMKAPKKWIYPVPPKPDTKEGANRKNFILIAEDMEILSYKKNLKAYKNKMTKEILNAFYTMLTELKLIDSVYADNTPFAKDGRLAFVDSEHSLDTSMAVPITEVAQYLSPEMHRYWEQLIVNGIPK